MLFCFKSELFCDRTLFLGDIYGFKFSKFLTFTLKIPKKNYDIIVASIVVWRSYFAHSGSQIHFTLFYFKFTFVANLPLL